VLVAVVKEHPQYTFLVAVVKEHPQYTFLVAVVKEHPQYTFLVAVVKEYPQYTFLVAVVKEYPQYTFLVAVVKEYPQYTFLVAVVKEYPQYTLLVAVVKEHPQYTFLVAVVKEHPQYTSWAVETVSFILAVAMDGAATTEGSISSVVGSTVTALWNSAKPHRLATGTLLSGNVGTARKRFQVSFGQPLEYAQAMADHAASWGAFCLLADCSAFDAVGSDHMVRSFTRIVDCWSEASSRQVVRIYQPLLHRLEELMQSFGDMGFAAPESPTGGKADFDNISVMLNDYFLNASSSKFKQLEEAAQREPDDTGLASFIRAFKGKKLGVSGARCQFLFSALPAEAVIPLPAEEPCE
ncbi:hypothetical protein DIPPA_13545, partial [Diplonema papillatum]